MLSNGIPKAWILSARVLLGRRQKHHLYPSYRCFHWVVVTKGQRMDFTVYDVSVKGMKPIVPIMSRCCQWRWTNRSTTRTTTTTASGEFLHYRNKEKPTPRSIDLNKRIISMGKQPQDLLKLADQEWIDFSNVNIATIFSQLGRLDSSHPILRKTAFFGILRAVRRRLDEEDGIAYIGARQIATIVHALGKLHINTSESHDILKWLCQEEMASAFMEDANPQEIAMVAWTCATLRYEHAITLFNGIDAKAEWLFTLGDAQNISNIVWACATLDFPAPSLVQLIKRDGHLLLTDEKRVSPQSISNTVSALAKINGKNAHSFFAAIDASSRGSQWMVENGTTQATANTVWAYATSRYNAPNLLSAIDHNATKLLDHGKPSEVAIIAWACANLAVNAKIQNPIPNYMSELGKRSLMMVQHGDTQSVSNTAWAMATLKVPATTYKRLLETINGQARRYVLRSTSQHITNVAWAYVILNHTNARVLFDCIDSRTDKILDEGKPYEIATLAWAFAKMGYPDSRDTTPKLFTELDRRSDQIFQRDGCCSQDVAKIAWAFAKKGIIAPNLFRNIAQQYKQLLDGGNPQDMANIAWAFASFECEAPHLFADIDLRSTHFGPRASSQELSNILWAFATLGYDAPNLLATINQVVDESFLQKGGVQDIANMCYAISIAGQCKNCEALLLKLWQRLSDLYECSMTSENKFGELALFQLAQSHFYADLDGVVLPQRTDNITAAIQQAIQGLDDKNLASDMVNEIATLLQQHFDCPPPAVEVPVNGALGKMLAIDLVLVWPDNDHNKIAIEIDGPTHYLRNLDLSRTNTENGSTRAKRRMLQQLGWTVVNIDFRDYNQVRSDPNMAKDWLANKLKNYGISVKE